LARCLVSEATTVVLANNGIDGIQCSTVRNNNAIQNQIALFTFANFENPYGGGAGVATGTVDIDPTAQGMTTITDDLTQIQIRTRVVTGGAVLAAALVK
jgi:hypothetical protein